MLNKWLESAKSKQNFLSASRDGIWQFRDIPISYFFDINHTPKKRFVIILNSLDVENYDIDLIDDTAYWSFEVSWRDCPKSLYHQVACVGHLNSAPTTTSYEQLIFKYQP